MLHNAYGKNGASVGSQGLYSASDLWVRAGIDMMTYVLRSDNLQYNFFKNHASVIDSDDLKNILQTHDGLSDGKTMLGTKKVDLGNRDDAVFYRETLRSAASAEKMAENAARSALSVVVDHDGKPVTLSNGYPVKVNKAPELEGPVIYTNAGLSGYDLESYKVPDETGYHGRDFHSVVVAFSDFTVTPVIPNNEKNVYITTDEGTTTSVSSEKKLVSDVKNYSGETITASQSISESTSSTVTSNISGSRGTSTTDAYGLSNTIKVGAKFSIEKIFESSMEESMTIASNHSTTETVSKGWSTSEGTAASESESRTVSVPLPPYTTALMSQQRLTSTLKSKYNCPVGLNYKATVYYVYGGINNNVGDISFDKLTEFGASVDVGEDLRTRFMAETGTDHTTDKDGINWDSIMTRMGNEIRALSRFVPFDPTPAAFSAQIDRVKTEVDKILPIYTIDSIKFVNPNNVLTSRPWLSEINMEVGDTNYTNNYSLRALNKYGGDFYTFYKPNGTFVFRDEANKDITKTGNSVIEIETDPVSDQLKFKAVGEGTVYLEYKIKDDRYQTASMAASTPDEFIRNDSIPHRAVLQINVEDNGHKHVWLKPRYTWSEDYSTCTATCICKYDDTHIMQETSDAELIAETKADGGKTYSATFATEGFETQTITVKQDTAEHQMSSWEIVDESRHTRVCLNDPTHVETAMHNWDDGTVTVPATVESGGEFVYTCRDCGAVKKVSTEKLSKANVYARMAAKGKRAEVITWKKVKDADGYMVYFSRGGTSDTYGTCRLVKTIANNNTFRYTKKKMIRFCIKNGMALPQSALQIA